MLRRTGWGPLRARQPTHGGSAPKGACTVKINVALVKCGRCGKKYNNPLTHVCATRMDRRPSSRSTKVKPKLTVRCGSCGHALGNPLTHRCTAKTDFKRRKAAAAKPGPSPKPASTGNAHEYAACNDDDCPRFPCRVYKEGLANGIEEGFQLGYAEGHAKGYAEGHAKGWREGYNQGFPDGIAACPLPHQG